MLGLEKIPHAVVAAFVSAQLQRVTPRCGWQGEAGTAGLRKGGPGWLGLAAAG